MKTNKLFWNIALITTFLYNVCLGGNPAIKRYDVGKGQDFEIRTVTRTKTKEETQKYRDLARIVDELGELKTEKNNRVLRIRELRIEEDSGYVDVRFLNINSHDPVSRFSKIQYDGIDIIIKYKDDKMGTAEVLMADKWLDGVVDGGYIIMGGVKTPLSEKMGAAKRDSYYSELVDSLLHELPSVPENDFFFDCHSNMNSAKFLQLAAQTKEQKSEKIVPYANENSKEKMCDFLDKYNEKILEAYRDEPPVRNNIGAGCSIFTDAVTKLMNECGLEAYGISKSFRSSPHAFTLLNIEGIEYVVDYTASQFEGKNIGLVIMPLDEAVSEVFKTYNLDGRIKPLKLERGEYFGIPEKSEDLLKRIRGEPKDRAVESAKTIEDYTDEYLTPELLKYAKQKGVKDYNRLREIVKKCHDINLTNHPTIINLYNMDPKDAEEMIEMLR